MEKGLNGKRLFPSRDENAISLEYFTSRSFENSDGTPTAIFTQLQENNEHAPLKSSVPSKYGCGSSKTTLKMIVTSMFIISLALTVAVIVEIYNGDYVKLSPHSAVVSDNSICTQKGMSVLEKGGSAVDAAVAAILCLSVIYPHVTGLGGGGFMLIYNHKLKQTFALDFRETAPSNISDQALGSVVGVPGLLHGLSTAHKEFGKLPWPDVIKPSIDLARNGFSPSPFLEEVLKQNKYSPAIQTLFYTHSGNLRTQIILPDLANTLQTISKTGIEDFYNGTIGKNIIKEINENGGNFTDDDLAEYRTEKTDALSIKWKNFIIQSSSFPSSGPILLETLKLMENVTLPTLEKLNITDFSHNVWEKFIQIFKRLMDEIAEGMPVQYHEEWLDVLGKNGENFSISNFASRMGSNNEGINADENKASSVIAVDNDEIFVSLISGLGSYFGSQIVTSDGIIMNDALKDQMIYTENPPKTKNKNSFSSIGRKPLTSLTPVIIFENNNICGLRLATSGASSSLVTQFVLSKLLLEQTTYEAIESIRVGILFPEKQITFVGDHPQPPSDVLRFYQSPGFSISPFNKPYSSVSVIAKENDVITALTSSNVNGSAFQI